MVSENDYIVRLRRDDKIRFIAPNTNLSLWLFEKRKIQHCTARWQHRSPPQIGKKPLIWLSRCQLQRERDTVENVDLVGRCVASATGQGGIAYRR